MKSLKLNFIIVLIFSLFFISFISANENEINDIQSSELNCSTIFCPKIPTSCPSGQGFSKTCCPQCVNCSTYPCTKIGLICKKGFHPGRAPNECCPSCIKCDPTTCPREEVICKEGYHPEIPTNKCCVECIKCNKKCPLIKCSKGGEVYQAQNECCKRCRYFEASAN